MTQSELEQFNMEIKQDYVKLLDLLAHVLAADNYLSFGDENERLLIARSLTNKFIEHAVTILHLSHGISLKLPSFKFSFIDSASIDVLARATLEAFLTFHYVFYAPITKEEKDYRCWCYQAAGIVERRDFPALTEEFKQKLVADKEQLDKLHRQLKANAVFQGLTEKQKKRISKGEWRLKSWREIATDAGFSKMIASNIYRSLSGRAHSSSLSVVQTMETHISRRDEQDISSSMGIMDAVIANMVREYCGLFSKARDVLSKDSEGSGSVDWWIRVGSGLGEFTNIG